MQPSKFSLIMPTLGRDFEIARFLKTLARQNYTNFELIIIDQNNDNRVEKVLLDFAFLSPKIKHIKSNARGASRARNEGIKHCSGDIVTFPDDDCEYAENVLEEMAEAFSKTDYDIITARHVADWVKDTRKIKEFIPLNVYNIWPYGIEFVIFLRREALNRVGLFDEELGVGSGTPFGSGEGTDYLLRAIKSNLRLFYCSDIIIKHNKVIFDQPNINRKAFKYSVGRRYVLDKYGYNYFFILLNVWHPILKLLLSVYSLKKIQYYWYQFLGRLKIFRNVELLK